MSQSFYSVYVCKLRYIMLYKIYMYESVIILFGVCLNVMSHYITYVTFLLTQNIDF